MRKLGWILGLFLFAAVPFVITADPADHDKAADSKELVGNPIDLMCYLGAGKSGVDHAGCAQACVGKGKPAGLLVKEGDKNQVYLAIGNDDNTPAKSFKDLWGKQVKVTGKVTDKEGIKVIEITKVEEAK